MTDQPPVSGKNNVVLYTAFAANVGIAIAKFIAAALTNSSSMLTEGVHSLVDSGNQILLLHGQRQAKRPPDAEHPFGYGRELYFWAFVVAIMIFAVGAGASIYEGVQHVRNPEKLVDPHISFIVLGIAFLMEGSSWLVALKGFNRTRGGLSLLRALKQSRDPPTFIVLFEDSAALIGLVIAALGIGLSSWTGDSRYDGMASIAIGLVLAVVAVLLARASKELIIGEAADPALIAKLRALLETYPEVKAVNHVRTIHTAPESIFVAVSVDFDDSLTMGRAEPLIERMETAMRGISPSLASIYIRPERSEDAVKPSPLAPG